MSDVPGSLKVTRCSSKPAAFSRFSRTPSAPASTGVTDGQRTRSRVMETASFIARLNTPNRRRASLVRYHFDLALRVPGRPRICWRKRIGAEPVGLPRTPEAVQLDKTPDAENEGHEAQQQDEIGIVGQPAAQLVVESWDRHKRDGPPGALVAVVEALDRGREVDPQEQHRARRFEQHNRQFGQGPRSIEGGIEDPEKIVDAEAEVEGAVTSEEADQSRHQGAQKYHRAYDDQPREPQLGAVDAAFEAEEIPDPVHRATSGRRSFPQSATLVAQAGSGFEPASDPAGFSGRKAPKRLNSNPAAAR